MIQRRWGTLGYSSLLSGSNRSSSHFLEFELTAERQEHMKMTSSYGNNRIWKRLTLKRALKTCLQQVTNHHTQICYLQSTKTTVYYRRYLHFVTPLIFSFVCIVKLGDDLWPHSREGSEKSMAEDFQFSHLT